MAGMHRRKHVERYTCTWCKKRGYPDRKTARRIVREMRREQRTDRPEQLTSYQCDSGSGLWHVGHRNPHTRGADRNTPGLRFVEDRRVWA